MKLIMFTYICKKRREGGDGLLHFQDESKGRDVGRGKRKIQGSGSYTKEVPFKESGVYKLYFIYHTNA